MGAVPPSATTRSSISRIVLAVRSLTTRTPSPEGTTGSAMIRAGMRTPSLAIVEKTSAIWIALTLKP